MRSDPQVVRFDSIAHVNPARRVHKGQPVPFIDMAALPQHSRDISPADVGVREAKGAGAHFQNGDTLLARITPCLENGKTAQVRGLNIGAVGEGSTEFIVLSGIDPADNDFVYYLCRTTSFREYAIGRMEGTSGRQRVAWQAIAAYEFSCPSPHVRRSAARALAALDDRIDLLRQTNVTLESIAQALFKSWFVNFDPVRAKQAGREPEGMDAATAALFPAELEESALGLIPKGWNVGALVDLAELNVASWTSKRAPVEVAYIDLAGVKANVFDEPQRFAFEDAPSRARRELRDGDTLVGTVRPGNRSFGFIAKAEAGLTGSTGFAVLSPKKSEVAAFTYLCATRNENIERLASLADGGAYPAVRPELVASTQSILPATAVMNAFASIAYPLLNVVASNARRARTLADIRDTLLPRLISGKLRLPEAQEQLEDVLA